MVAASTVLRATARATLVSTPRRPDTPAIPGGRHDLGRLSRDQQGSFRLTTSDDRRTVPKQQRSRRAWTAVVDAADELFAEKGYDATQMGEIIERSGVGAGSLYRFFADKRDIAEAIITRRRAGMDQMTAALPPVTSLEELWRLTDAVVELAAAHRRDHPGYHAAADVLDGRDPESPLYATRQDQIDFLIGMVGGVGTHISIAERRSSVQYAAEILDGLLKGGPHGGESQAEHLAHIKRAIRGYFRELLLESE